MKKFLIFLIAIPLLLVLAAALLLPLFLDKDKILELASQTLHDKTGATLEVAGAVELDLFPKIGISLEDVKLTMPEEQQADLNLRSLLIGVQVMPLLSGRVEIDTIGVDGLNASLRAQEDPEAIDTSTYSDQQLDAFYAKRSEAKQAAGAAAGSQAALAVPLALNVQTLKVTNSRLELIDVTGTETTVVELQSLKATGLNLDARPIPLSLKVRLPGEQPIELALDGEVRIDQQRQIMTVDEIALAVTGATAQPLKIQTRGEVDINRQIADLQLKLELGESRGDGSLRYASFESPQIDTKLKMNLLNPALLLLAGPQATAATESEPTPDGGDDPLPLDAIRAVDSRADLSIERAVLGAHTIEDLRLKLRAVNGIIQLSSVTGALHGGKLDLQATFNGKHNTATLDTTGGLTELDIATALAAMASRPVVSGRASLNWTLNSKGRTSNELVAAMAGPIKLATAKMVLNDIGLEKIMCQGVALVNQEQLTATFPANTSFQALNADIQLAEGKAQLSPLRAELPQIALTGSGTLDLLNQDFKTTFKARLSPELEQLDKACRVSKRLTNIDWPVDCKGNVNGDPAKWCGVDSKAIIEDLAKYEAKRKLQKETGKLFDKLLKK